MTTLGEDVIVVGDPQERIREEAGGGELGSVEVIEEAGATSTSDEDAAGLDDVEPMPLAQRAVLAFVGVVIVLGIIALVAYWSGHLG